MAAPFNGVKIFSATMFNDRLVLGEKVTQWLQEKRKDPSFELVDFKVTQSSDEAFHCIAMNVFYNEKLSTKA